ncbi:MAG: hypothetical protein IKJ43_00575 [Bacilli bacterium]|nr:hypothetical protein [Bacilli bacterium]
MDFKFVPDTYDRSLINNLNLSSNFNNLQLLYKKAFEKYYGDMIKAYTIDKYIKDNNLFVPSIDDSEYNFYHKDSSLGSNYLFLRNNIHIERLNVEEIRELSNNPSKEFIDKTFKNVLFESDENISTFFGTANDQTRVLANSLVFEFSYDMKKLESLEQLKQIEELINRVRYFVENEIPKQMGVNTSFIEYKAIPDLFIEKKQRKILL